MTTPRIETQDPEAWFEIPYPGDGQQPAPRRVATKDVGPLTGTYPRCGCWRCSGGVALADRPTLDRLFARHLTRLPPAEAAESLRGWRAHPRHDALAREQINAWLRIVGPMKSQEPPPAYPVISVPEGA